MSCPVNVKGCLRKRQYLDEASAKRAIVACKQRRPEADLRAYKCPQCAGWHLSSKWFTQQRCGTFLEPFDPSSKLEWQCPACRGRE